MKTGILTSGISQDFEKALQVVREGGFDYVELQFMWGIEAGHHSEEQNREVKRLLDKYGIKVSAMLKNLFTGMTVSGTEVGDKRYAEELAVLRKTIELARYFGCNITRCNSFDKHNVVFGSGGADVWLSNRDKAWKKFLSLMEPACQMAVDAEIDLMVETGTNGFIHSAALARKAIDDLRCPRFKVLWDPANCLFSMENPMRGYEAIRGHIAEIHIKDIRVDKPMARVAYCPVGRGEMGMYLDDLASALKHDQWDGVVVFENQVSSPEIAEEQAYHWSIPRFKEAFS